MKILTSTRGLTLGGFGGALGLAALFLLSDVPRVRKDIMQVGIPARRRISVLDDLVSRYMHGS